MKNVGVPETPLRSALSTSSATRAAPASWRRSSVNRSTSRPQLLSVGDQVVRDECVLVGEQEIVHLPERALVGGGLGGFRGELGAGMDVVQRQVPPDVAHVTEITEELADDRLRLPAVGAFEIAVLDDRDRRLDRSANVVALRVDIDVEVDDRLRGPEQAVTAAASRTAAPSVSVRRNSRSGVSRFRAQAVRPENSDGRTF
jgi:hypothetical protein